jgi:hypothetical protein
MLKTGGCPTSPRSSRATTERWFYASASASANETCRTGASGRQRQERGRHGQLQHGRSDVSAVEGNDSDDDEIERFVTKYNFVGDDMRWPTKNRMRRAYCSSFWLKRSQGEHNGLCSCLYITTRLEFRRTGSDRSDSYIRKKEKQVR